MRQRGRERARSVIDVAPDPAAIVEGVERATSSAFRASLVGMTSPYGDGHAGERIAEILADLTLGDDLLIKRAVHLDPAESPLA
jgi:UDP-N-acetylglucosamine 2-epimerase